MQQSSAGCCSKAVRFDMQAFDITSEENPSFVGGALHSGFRPQTMRTLPCMHLDA